MTDVGFKEENLLEDVQYHFEKEPLLSEIFGFSPDEIKSSAELLAAVLAGLVQDKQARQTIRSLACDVFMQDQIHYSIAIEDLIATAKRDIDTGGIAKVLLFAPGYQGLLSYRLARALFLSGRDTAAFMIQALFCRILNIDIAPQADIGRRVWIDHGLGVVIGRTSIVEDDVSLWHGVTLGSNLIDTGSRRHPLIGKGAVLGAHSSILGGIEVGAGAVVASGAIVTRSVPERVTVYGPKAAIRDRGEDSFGGFDT